MMYSWDTSVNKRKKTIIYGAGNAGVQLVESLKKSVDYAPIAFIDEDQADPAPTNIRFGFFGNLYETKFIRFNMLMDVQKLHVIFLLH